MALYSLRQKVWDLWGSVVLKEHCRRELLVFVLLTFYDERDWRTEQRLEAKGECGRVGTYELLVDYVPDYLVGRHVWSLLALPA